MKFSKPQIAAAIVAVLTLIVGIIFVAMNSTSQDGSTDDVAAPAPITADSANPQQALIHTIAACDAYATGRYFTGIGEVETALEYMNTAATEASTAKSFDEKWDRFADLVAQVNDTSVLNSVYAQESTDNGWEGTNTYWYLPDVFSKPDQVCESIIDRDVTVDIANKMACAAYGDWKYSAAVGMSSLDSEHYVGEATTYASFGNAIGTPIEPGDDPRKEWSPLYESLWELFGANRDENRSAIREHSQQVETLCESMF